MPQFDFSTVITYSAQIVSAAVVALLLFAFQQRYRKSYLRHWSSGWAALAVYHAASLAGLALARHYQVPASAPSRLAAALLVAVAGYASIGWFLFAPYEIVRRRPVRIRNSKRILLALSAFGVLTALVFLDSSTFSISRNFARTGVHAFVAGIGFLVASIALWRTRGARMRIGLTVLSIGYFLYALDQLQYAFFAAAWAVAGDLPRYLNALGYADFLLQSIVAIGVIACLLEDEREAAELASAEVEHLAYYDALTGLPNRPLFIDRLIVSIAQSHRSGHRIAVLFLDLDRFKDINDSLGHSIGDQLLKTVAERMRQCTREGDTLARFGGDEFTLLIPKIDAVEDAAKIAHKILETVKIPVTVGDRELVVTGSMGVSIYPNDGLDAETLVRNADTAMYRAKDAGRDNYHLYAPAMNARAVERLAIENMLRKAITNNELVLHYQPVMDTATRSIIGVEALVRWQHPELGLLSPAHFISIAEASGLIIPMGEWIIETALRQLKAWQHRISPDLRMAINLSARQFQQQNLLAQIRAAVKSHGVDPHTVELEITESNAMQNAENTIRTLRELKNIGIRIAMDDFGTGYSSLNYLKRFPIDTLKLDLTFVQGVLTDASDAAIVSAVIAMAHSLDLEVVAEGVEIEAQLDFLQRQRCDSIQGYFFSAPLAAEDIEPFLIAKNAAAV